MIKGITGEDNSSKSLETLIVGKKQCPACGKYVDKERRICPECTANFSYRIKESTLVKFSLIFVVLGIVFFLIAAYWQSGITNVEDLDRHDNFTIQRFKGKVIASPKYKVYAYDDYGEMTFDIHDGTGKIQVLCNRKVTEDLIKNARIPVLGDTVEATGRVLFIEKINLGDLDNITLSDDGIKIYVGGKAETLAASEAFKRVEVVYEENFKINPDKPNRYQKKSIADVAGKPEDTFEKGTKVMMSGTVVSALTNYSKAYQFTIKDEASGDKLLVYVPKSVVELSAVELYSPDDIIFDLKPKSKVTILGALEYYKNKYDSKYDK